MSLYRVPVGSVDPVALVVNITACSGAPDLTAVTSAEIVSVDNPTRTESIWGVEILIQTATLLQIAHRYLFADTATLRRFRQRGRLWLLDAANPVETEQAWELEVVAR